MLFDCDPDEITSALGLVPDEIRRRGERACRNTGDTVSADVHHDELEPSP